MIWHEIRLDAYFWGTPGILRDFDVDGQAKSTLISQIVSAMKFGLFYWFESKQLLCCWIQEICQ